MKIVPTAPLEFLLDQVSNGYRYRVIKTPLGYLITARSRDLLGLMIPCEWLHRTNEAAVACALAAIAANQYWELRSTDAEPAALQDMSDALEEHSRICEQLGDSPLVGEEVRELRRSLQID